MPIDSVPEPLPVFVQDDFKDAKVWHVIQFLTGLYSRSISEMPQHLYSEDDVCHIRSLCDWIHRTKPATLVDIAMCEGGNKYIVKYIKQDVEWNIHYGDPEWFDEREVDALMHIADELFQPIRIKELKKEKYQKRKIIARNIENETKMDILSNEDLRELGLSIVDRLSIVDTSETNDDYADEDYYENSLDVEIIQSFTGDKECKMAKARKYLEKVYN